MISYLEARNIARIRRADREAGNVMLQDMLDRDREVTDMYADALNTYTSKAYKMIEGTSEYTFQDKMDLMFKTFAVTFSAIESIDQGTPCAFLKSEQAATAAAVPPAPKTV